MVDCEPAIVREVVNLALAGLPGVVLLAPGSPDADVVVGSKAAVAARGERLFLVHDAGGLGRLLEAIRGLLREMP
jgi:hypothetical protein